MTPKDKKIIEDSERAEIPIFVLTAKDVCALNTLSSYLNECVRAGCSFDHIHGIHDRIVDFRYWQQHHNTKLPD